MHSGKKSENAEDRAETDLCSDPEFVASYLKGLFTESIFQAMEEEGLTRCELATALGKSRQHVARVLNEEASFTIETMVRFCMALDRRLSLVVHRADEIAVTQPRE